MPDTPAANVLTPGDVGFLSQLGLTLRLEGRGAEGVRVETIAAKLALVLDARLRAEGEVAS